MKNQEHIEMMRQIKGYLTAGNPIWDVDKIAETCDAAISALEFRDKYDQFWEEVKTAGMNGKETEIRHSGRVFRIREVAQ